MYNELNDDDDGCKACVCACPILAIIEGNSNREAGLAAAVAAVETTSVCVRVEALITVFFLLSVSAMDEGASYS